MSLRIETTHHVDAAEPDADGNVAWHYAYELHRFRDGAACLVARGYDDEPDAAHFLSLERNGEARLLAASDLKLPLTAAAIRYLHGRGRHRLSWLCDGSSTGYEAVPAAIVAAALSQP